MWKWYELIWYHLWKTYNTSSISIDSTISIQQDYQIMTFTVAVACLMYSVLTFGSITFNVQVIKKFSYKMSLFPKYWPLKHKMHILTSVKFHIVDTMNELDVIYNEGCHQNTCTVYIKLSKGKSPRKHSLHEKTAASVLLKLSSVVMNDATPLTPPSAWAELHFQM